MLAKRKEEIKAGGIDVDEIIEMNTKVWVTVHAPMFFKSIQDCDGVTNDNLIASLSPSLNRDSVFKSGEGAGQSGSFFFFSHDRKFIIKTMSGTEMSLFLEILPDYEIHLKENPDSLLARIYGVYTI